MYKQCFELLTAQGKSPTNNSSGPRPQKAFSIVAGTNQQEVLKEFDTSIKNNVFVLAGQRIQLPPNPSSAPSDFHHPGPATKKMNVSASLNVVHPYLVLQIFVERNMPFSLEIYLRDRNNVRIDSVHYLLGSQATRVLRDKRDSVLCHACPSALRSD